MMQVTLSVGGRFHAFYLAQQLLKRGYLQKLITSYPKFEVRKYGIPSDKVTSVLIKEIFQRSWVRLPYFVRDKFNPNFFILDLFDKRASQEIDRPDIFVGWAGFTLLTLRKAKESGAITILERGSAHLLYQIKLLREEYEKYGFKFNGGHPKVVEKEMQEYQEADYISVPSLFAKQSFLEKGFPEEKLVRVPYGVNLSEFKQIPKNDQVFRAVTVGGDLQKGTHYLLQAFNELDLPDSEIIILGNLSKEIQVFLKRYYNNKIKWVDHKPQRELYKYYSQGSVFVMPSIQEGLAMVQVQAMACGLPLICTTNTGGGDLIEDGKEGFIIPIRDVNALKEKILFFYENPKKCRDMGEAAKRRVRQGFSWDDYGEKIVGEYERIVSRQSSLYI